MKECVIPVLCSRLPLLSLLSLGLLAGARAADVSLAPTPLTAPARRVLEAYRADTPKPVSKKLHIICWRTREREFPASYRVRLQRMMEHIRDARARAPS